MEFFISALIAILSSSIWIYYFSSTGLSQGIKKGYILMMFLLGVFSYYLFYKVVNCLLGGFTIDLSRESVSQLFISVVKNGLIGQFIKLTPIFIVYYLFRNKLNQPLYVLLFFSISVLGFASAENLRYSLSHEFYVFDEKVILRTLGELFCTSIVAYSLIDYRFKSRKKKPLRIVLFILLAAVLHGFYDYWLYYERLNSLGFIVTVFLFFFGASVFAVTITNSINISENFSYGKIYGSKKVINKMLKFYALLILFQLLYLGFNKQVLFGFNNLKDTLWFTGLIIFVSVSRMNYLKTIELRWNKLKVELPFGFYKIDVFNGRKLKRKFKFKGETFNEKKIEDYYGVMCSIHPLSNRDSFITKPKLIILEKKLFFKHDETFYLIKLVSENLEEYMLLKPKTSGKDMVKRKYPIVALLTVHHAEDFSNFKLTTADFQFREWVYLKHK